MFRFLVSMVAVRLGAVREVTRRMLNGEHVVILVDDYSEQFYRLVDPQLGEAESDLVDQMLQVLGGGDEASHATA